MKIRQPQLLTAALLAALFGSGAALAANDSPRDHAATKDMSHESDQPVSDTWITTKVKSELLADTEVKGTDINVSTTNGVVTLAGVLDSKDAVNKAVAVTKGIKGVKSVDTQALKSRGS